jgi:hypothetical protein
VRGSEEVYEERNENACLLCVINQSARVLKWMVAHLGLCNEPYLLSPIFSGSAIVSFPLFRGEGRSLSCHVSAALVHVLDQRGVGGQTGLAKYP